MLFAFLDDVCMVLPPHRVHPMYDLLQRWTIFTTKRTSNSMRAKTECRTSQSKLHETWSHWDPTSEQAATTPFNETNGPWPHENRRHT